MDYQEIYHNNKESLLQAVKDSGYSLSDLKETASDMSLMQIIVELFM